MNNEKKVIWLITNYATNSVQTLCDEIEERGYDLLVFYRTYQINPAIEKTRQDKQEVPDLIISNGAVRGYADAVFEDRDKLDFREKPSICFPAEERAKEFKAEFISLEEAEEKLTRSVLR